MATKKVCSHCKKNKAEYKIQRYWGHSTVLLDKDGYQKTWKKSALMCEECLFNLIKTIKLAGISDNKIIVDSAKPRYSEDER